MNLGVFLSIGETFADFKSKGQYELILDFHLKNYSRHFEKVFVFSYGNEAFSPLPNVFVLPNTLRLHRYVYSLMLPFFYKDTIASCHVLRGLQLTSGIPSLISHLFFKIPYILYYGYDYKAFAEIEGKDYLSYFYGLISTPILMGARRIIVTSRHIQSTLSKAEQQKTTLIPNGVDTSLFKYKLPTNSKRILFIGRFEKQKNLTLLISALGNLLKYKFTLVLVGKGTLENQLLKQAKKQNVDLVLHSPISHRELPAVFHEAGIFILPSLIEGQPKVLLEAMSSGVPVVASNIEAHQEIIKSRLNGILFDPTVKSLTRAIVDLMGNPKLYKSISRNARKIIEINFEKEMLNFKEIRLLKEVTEKV